jgi:hypothetical protein
VPISFSRCTNVSAEVTVVGISGGCGRITGGVKETLSDGWGLAVGSAAGSRKVSTMVVEVATGLRKLIYRKIVIRKVADLAALSIYLEILI